ncbi:EDD domain protein, DegV family [Peptoniphilus asaccharolyticus DSM 20463]|uniref:EDD domain protein, DegV family n=1 Tax=Peptoniphilus asaccharolyticus DSM 20463 TaxID=573058 RepID=A0A1W1VGQ0_PEPAS|nr:DegV family protein [Peptoniphilus asaccharolyticus]MBL7575839.1 DegV family protein [Peptoniphilus asaccharolyticus]SMB92476.1 EDD domain protein, DegV family [Peptoniphilus asaccharolyticus DSM 20463]
MSIKIITDGGCDISKDILEALDVEMLPIYVNNDEQVFYEGELSIEDMFSRMRAGEVFMTSQVSNQIYQERFEDYASKGQEVIYICLSSGISGTFDAAKLIAENINEKYGEKIHVFDSKLATVGLGYMVEKAAELAKTGADFEKIMKLLEFYKDGIKENFSVTSLEFLMRGGRVSRSSAIIGGLLNIRPMLRVIPENGKLEVVDKVRGDKNMVKKFIENLRPEVVNQPVILGYGDTDEYAMKVKDALIKNFDMDPKYIRTEKIGHVIGAHVGPEFIAVIHTDIPEENLKLD